MESIESELNKAVCSSCNLPLAGTERFCPSCGAAQVVIKDYEREFSLFDTRFKWLAVYYVVTLVACRLPGAFEYFSDFSRYVWIEVFLAVWTLLFAIHNATNLLPLYRLSFKTLLVSLAVVPLFVLFSILVSTSAGFVNNLLSYPNESSYEFYAYLENSIPVYIFSISVLPAVFEEMASRGFIYNHVEEVAGTRYAIIISAITFALLHASVLSLYWLVPFALFLGWMRHKTSSVIPGMFAHFSFNLTVCIVELNEFGELSWF